MDRIDPPELERYARTLLEAVGASERTATSVAESLVTADLRGHSSHGVIRIPLYDQMIDDGVLDPTATPEVVRERGATVAVDGNDAFGQVVGRRTVDAVVEKAKTHGVAIGGIRNGSHLGRVGEWGEVATDAGLLFTANVNTQGGGQSVAPAGSTTRRFATNPLVYAVPTFDRLKFPILLDISTAQVAHGKISQYEHADRELPDGWAVSPDGESITSPADVNAFSDTGERGALRPLGGTTSGYKGTGLSVLTELFAGIVGRAPVVGQTDPEWFSNAASFVAIDPLAFSSIEAIESKVDSVVTQLEETPMHPDVSVGTGAFGEELLVPGEAEYESTRQRTAEGIPVPDCVKEALRTLAVEHDLQADIPDSLQ